MGFLKVQEEMRGGGEEEEEGGKTTRGRGGCEREPSAPAAPRLPVQHPRRPAAPGWITAAGNAAPRGFSFIFFPLRA